jgi:ABC-type Zn2+ transport system substrate-binding protein/surface adhesin
MSDSINKSLAYLIPLQEQKLSENIIEFKEILTEYEERIFDSLYIDQEYYDVKI